MSHIQVYVISSKNRLWKVNTTKYTTEKFVKDENGYIKLQNDWILYGADPHYILKKFNDCFLSFKEADDECKKRNSKIGYVNTESKDKQREFVHTLNEWIELINVECSIWYNCSVYDKNDKKLLMNNKKFRFAKYNNQFLKIISFYEASVIMNLKDVNSIEVNKLDFKFGGYKVDIGNYLIYFIHAHECTNEGERFVIKDIIFDKEYKIVHY